MAPLWTDDLLAALAANGKSSAAGIASDGKTPDHVPVLKLFTPTGGATWLLTEYYSEDGRFFGLCGPRHGSPEPGYVNCEESRRPADAASIPGKEDIDIVALARHEVGMRTKEIGNEVGRSTSCA